MSWVVRGSIFKAIFLKKINRTEWTLYESYMWKEHSTQVLECEGWLLLSIISPRWNSGDVQFKYKSNYHYSKINANRKKSVFWKYNQIWVSTWYECLGIWL